MTLNISELSGPELVTLFHAVMTALPKADYPQLIEEQVTDDGETYDAVRCPVCGSLVSDSDDIYAVDVALRWTSAEFRTDYSTVELDGGHDADYGDTLYYKHGDGKSSHAVSLPDGWTEEWA